MSSNVSLLFLNVFVARLYNARWHFFCLISLVFILFTIDKLFLFLFIFVFLFILFNVYHCW